jgi:hypothetical protein
LAGLGPDGGHRKRFDMLAGGGLIQGRQEVGGEQDLVACGVRGDACSVPRYR